MGGTADGRTIAGAKKAAHRLAVSSREEDRNEAPVLQNLLKVVSSAENLQVARIATMQDDGELEKDIQVLLDHGAQFPPSVMGALVTRKIQVCIREQKWSDLLTICSPWVVQGKTSPFDPLNPTLAACDETFEGKLGLFNTIVFERTLIPMARKGADKIDAMIAFVNVCVHAFAAVDLVDLDAEAAVALDQWKTCWNCLLAIGSTGDLRMDHKDLRAWQLYTLDAVSEVHRNMDKTSKSILVMLAGAIHNCQLWRTRICDYVKKIPAMDTHGSDFLRIKRMMKELPTDIPKAIQHIHEVTTKLSVFSQALREGASDTLIHDTGKAIVDLWPAVQNDVIQAGGPGDMLKVWVESLAEAVVLRPMDAVLASIHVESVEALAKTNQSKLLGKTRDEFNTFASNSVVDDAVNLKSMDVEIGIKLSQKLRGMQVEPYGDIASTAKRVGLLMIKAFHDELFGAFTSPVNVMDFGKQPAIVENLAFVSGDGDMAKKTSAIKKSMELSIHLHELKKDGLTEPSQIAEAVKDGLATTVKIHRAIQQLDSIGAGCADAIAGSIGPLKDKSEVFLKEMQDEYVETRLQELKHHAEELVTIAKGSKDKDGKSWLHGFKGSTFQDLDKRATATISGVNPKDLVTGIASALKAEDKESVGEATAALQGAKITKLQARLLVHLVIEDVEKRRAGARAEIQAVRPEIPDWAAVLPEPMVRKVKDALAMTK
ncbi:unnamed protein product [Prorocentrum cordatum]|uniref:Uncharacterized protein n=1 Tax=Prorocentrum cordatum TaxID=2364126 RepID=A0ABN9Y320_9DINO|nr:unnamed protein product [Polarella glacialis]